MVCSCENHCSCEEHCACCGKCGSAVRRGKKTYNNSLFPVCKANLLDSSNEINLTSSTTTLSTEKGSRALNKKKFKKYITSKDSAVPLCPTLKELTLNDSKSLVSENEQTKLPVQKAPSMSRFNSLKQSMMKMRRRFKKLKIRKNDNCTLLALPERDHESTEESSVELTSSKEDFSPGKRTEYINNKSCSTGNIFQHFSKAQNISSPASRNNQNIKLTSRAKSLTFTFNVEDGTSDKQDCNLTETAATNLISRTQSRLYTKGKSQALQSCSTPLLFNSNPICVSNNKKGRYTSAEDRFNMINSKNSENFHDKKFSISFKPAIFKRNILKSKSISKDKSITEPLYSGYREQMSSKQLCVYAESLRSSIDGKMKNEFINCEINSQVTNSEVIKPFNESPEALNSQSRSTSHDKVETPQSLSPMSLHQSLVDRSVSELSSSETIGLDNSDIRDHGITDATTVNFVSSDGSDNFEAFEIRSSPDSTDSESVSSSEFLSCSYCRFVTCIPPISDSVIPYETLE